MIAGIDEAGRGSVIGPLVIAGISIKEQDVSKLIDLGVTDSKLLSPKKREFLASELKELVDNWHTVSLSPSEIDRVVESKRKLHKLNRLEAQAMARVLMVLKPNTAFVDAADVIPERFSTHIIENINFKMKIVSEHKADLTYPIVSGASIIAKVERDRAISQLQNKYGKIGSGYPSDPVTIKFLDNWIIKFGNYPNFVRKSWKTSKRVKNKSDPRQKKLQ